MTKTIILCDCLGSQSIDAQKVSDATGLACPMMFTEACGAQIEQAAALIAKGDVLIACQQEAPLFRELAEEIAAPEPAFVDLRDRAGWGDEGANPSAKMAALTAEALLARPAERTLDVVSNGACLILGSGEAALQAAQDLSATLAVTLLMPAPQETSPGLPYDIVSGTLARASGTLGQFSLRIDQFQQIIAGGRAGAQWTPPKDGALTECDVILDLSAQPALFAAPEKRDGYLRADPGSQPAVAKAVLGASMMVGTFEKPLYIRLEESLCAHSRAEQAACSKCLDICPTGAITSAGEHVAIDPMICAGCGACSALCPSGAISYDAPPVSDVFARLNTLSGTYRKAGGDTPRLLVHDDSFGSEMISLAARFGRGLPADVIPLSVPAPAGFGHAEMLAALACGFGDVSILLAPRTERPVLQSEAALAIAIAGRAAVQLIDVNDPDALSENLYGEHDLARVQTPILPLGTRRQVTRLAAQALQPEAEMIPLPDAAPYGAILVDQDACTLCLSCVSLCPAGALGDNPDKPQLRFEENACLQCGLCANICPEDAISLTPQLNLSDEAFTQKVMHEEEPFACVECGVLFGSKSTVERIMEKLAGKHAMFAKPETARMIQMCDNCRIQAQYHSENNPFAGKERPAIRTTDDYLSKRKDH
ncbi:Ion-translocating oxidoreductase complex subunit B [Roseobacter fucihabitans]|uniref:Ion-translocating oxidoreductase complex subunit B n=1 Tax=Roseobacter fucihabitans TaxID=1537242 RepID=A0ABZ2BRK7_9RHOB|nr:4Fe-4S binding protein [Roseobacter litoralis]MBC6964457.1 NADH-plastoquinone oxidoreductase subunit [Roseobacter litoralis]